MKKIVSLIGYKLICETLDVFIYESEDASHELWIKKDTCNE